LSTAPHGKPQRTTSLWAIELSCLRLPGCVRTASKCCSKDDDGIGEFQSCHSIDN